MSVKHATLLRDLFWDQSQLELFQFPDLHKAYFGISGVTFDTLLWSISKANIDQTDETGRTSLSWVCQTGDDKSAAQLLARGANPDTSDLRGRTPLHWSTYASSTACLRLLLAAKADVNAKDRGGRTALALSTGNHTDFLRLLLAS